MRKYVSEGIGTFILLFCGTGAVVMNTESGGAITHPGIAATWGLIVMALIFTLGEISGAHMNPAVTLSFWIAGKFPAREVAPYLLAQVAGAFAASGTLHLLFPAHPTLGATPPAGAPLQSFIIELLLAFLLMLVILQAAWGSKEQGLPAALVIGATILLEAMFAGPITGASMNPARSLAPAVVSGHTEHLWIYLTAPVAGMAAALPVWKFLNAQTKSS